MKTAPFLTTTVVCSLGATAFAWTPSTSSSSQQQASSSSRRAFFGKAASAVVVAPLILGSGGSPALADDTDAAATPAATPATETAVSAEAATTTTAVAAEVTPAVAETTPPPTVEEEAPAPPPAEEENEFIARLVKRSEANKDKYKAMAESNDKLSHRQFMSQYDRPSYVGVYNRDDTDGGSSKMFLQADFDKLLEKGEVVQSYMSKVSKKTGEISEDYSRPIYVFAN
eukprot:CAMPEP_0197190444 /NCGR_PEP_ID=MMETSP1423-20130617/21664_1 /TAXON_ID=476441 /ORGANISM="Pseudo-nitzschia heimii, Strain UNC1101" /LENGTH=227 /DNA_ID=CAMNT_0042642825 /DNA_START=125 /DNA_END=808 /DNA_ORIENTATION=+